MAGNILSPPFADDDGPWQHSVPGIGEGYDQFDPTAAIAKLAARTLRVVASVAPDPLDGIELGSSSGVPVLRLGKIALPKYQPNSEN